MNAEVVGYVGTVLSTIAFLPQVTKVYRTKQARDISYPAFILIGSGNAVWVTYGVMIVSFPVILANSVIGILVLTVIVLKFLYEKKSSR